MFINLVVWYLYLFVLSCTFIWYQDYCSIICSFQIKTGGTKYPPLSYVSQKSITDRVNLLYAVLKSRRGGTKRPPFNYASKKHIPFRIKVESMSYRNTQCYNHNLLSYEMIYRIQAIRSILKWPTQDWLELILNKYSVKSILIYKGSNHLFLILLLPTPSTCLTIIRPMTFVFVEKTLKIHLKVTKNTIIFCNGPEN